MPNYSSYPPVNQIPGVGGAQPAAGPGPAGPGAPAQGQNKGAMTLMSPIVNALKVLGISIAGAQRSGNPNAAAMSQNFSGLLQSMAQPSLDRGAAMPNQPAPGAPQPGAVQPQPAPAQAPAPVQAPAPAPTPAPAPQQVPAMQGQRPMGQGQGVKPFGQSQTQRPVNKQPVIL